MKATIERWRMSKAHMVVLSFLKDKPLHGYQMGQIVEQLKLPGWVGITMPAIYKAMQALEKSKHIRGEEMREGNNPPRTVYHLNPKGREYLKQLVTKYLAGNEMLDRDWWLALHFASGCLSRQELLAAIGKRIARLKEVEKLKKDCIQNLEPEVRENIPFVHAHLLALGVRYLRAEQRTLDELIRDIESGAHTEFFLSSGDQR